MSSVLGAKILEVAGCGLEVLETGRRGFGTGERVSGDTGKRESVGVTSTSGTPEDATPGRQADVSVFFLEEANILSVTNFGQGWDLLFSSGTDLFPIN